jgi:hypothetical protein
MHQIQYNQPKQHATEAEEANRALIHLLGDDQHRAPAVRAQERQQSLYNKYQCDCDRKYLPEIHILPRNPLSVGNAGRAVALSLSTTAARAHAGRWPLRSCRRIGVDPTSLK